MSNSQQTTHSQAPLQIQPGQNRQNWKFRLRLILLYGGIAILVALLARRNKGSVEVDISLKVSQMQFAMGDLGSAILFDSVETASLTLHNFRALELGKGELEIATTIEPEMGPKDWHKEAVGRSTQIISTDHQARMRLQNVTLNQLNIKPGTVVQLSSVEGEPDLLKIEVQGETSGVIGAGNFLEIDCSDCGISVLPDRSNSDFPFLRFRSSHPQELNFWGQSESVTVALRLPKIKLSEQNIPIEGDLRFTKNMNRISTVIGKDGWITLIDVEGKQIKVSDGDFVLLDDLKDFFIKTLEFDKGFNITLHGDVGKLETGPIKYVEDKRPSYLDWLYSSTLVRCVSAVALIGTTILTILRELRFIRKE